MRDFLVRVRDTEPARLAEFGRTTVAGLAALGWFTVDDAAVNTTASFVALAVSWGLTRFVRNRVTPVAKGE